MEKKYSKETIYDTVSKEWLRRVKQMSEMSE